MDEDRLPPPLDRHGSDPAGLELRGDERLRVLADQDVGMSVSVQVDESEVGIAPRDIWQLPEWPERFPPFELPETGEMVVPSPRGYREGPIRYTPVTVNNFDGFGGNAIQFFDNNNMVVIIMSIILWE